MVKSGHRLRELSTFQGELAERLRDEFSVTTAEEFVSLSKAAPQALSMVVGGEQQLERLTRAAESVISRSDLEEILEAARRHYPYSTGHEAPPEGETY